MKPQLGNKAVISGLDVLMTEDDILKELQEARVSKVIRISKRQNRVKDIEMLAICLSAMLKLIACPSMAPEVRLYIR